MSEHDYSDGHRAAWLQMLRECLSQLGTDSTEGAAHRWTLERCETVSKLREICEAFGDNDWADDLHLADVVEKHLFRPLYGRWKK